MTSSVEKDKALAQDILKLVGGKENVNSLIHCITRLRFTLKDEGKANDDAIKNLKGVMSVVHSGGQYQVVIGNKVTDIYNQVMPLLDFSSTVSVTDVDAKKDGNLASRAVAILSSLFLPMLGVMTGAGLLKGLLVLLTVTGILNQNSGTYMIWNAAGDALFYFLPIILGFSSARTFKVNEYIGAILGASLTYPTLVTAFTAGKSITFLGIHVTLMNYTQTMLPIVLAVYAMSWLEKLFKRIVPKAVQNIFVPFLDLFVTVPLTFLIVGPIMQKVSQWLATGSMWVYGLAPIVAGLFLGFVWQGAVIFGLHYAFIPILMNNLTTNNFDPINGILYCTLFGQVGAALAMGLKSKDPDFKEVALPASLSGLFGITEPIIYGVTLPHKRSFLMASIGSAVGGAVAAAFHAGMYTMPGGGIFGIAAFINPKGIDASFIAFVASLVISVVVSFILTLIFCKAVVPEEKSNTSVRTTEFKDEEIEAPVDGEVIALSDVKDEVFSTEVIGKGLAINPSNGEIYAPFDGRVVTVFPTKHALGLKSDNGVELLIHIGLDTVKLEGKYFDVKVKEGEVIKKGQLLESFNLQAIKEEGFDTVIPVVVTNPNNFDDILASAKGVINHGQQLILATVDQTQEAVGAIATN